PTGMAIYFMGAVFEIGGFIMSIFAGAKIISILAGYITTGNSDGVWFWLGVEVISTLFIALGFQAMEYAKRIIYYEFIQWSTTQYMSALCKFDIGDFYAKDRRNQINKVADAFTWKLADLAYANLDLLYALLRFLAIAAVVSQIAWWMVPVIAIFLIPTLFAEAKLANMQWFVWDQKGDERHIFWGLKWILQRPKNQMELRSSQASQYALNKIDAMSKDFYTEQKIKYKKANKAVALTKTLEVFGTVAGSVYLIKQLLERAISLDNYFFLSTALIRVGGSLNHIFGTLSRMQESLVFADSYFQLIDSKPKIIDIENSQPLVSIDSPEIIFKNVCFAYPEQDTNVFTDLNLHIKPGEHVALVGENGSGKSTLIKLLLRFYRPDSGQILIDGIDLQDIAIDSWYERIATLFQEFNSYPLSVKENIEIGRSDKKPDQKLLEESAKFADIDEMVQGYKYGWDTVLDASFKKGVEPSGGQWQRVAIARTFYRNAKMLILDEPTSAIDAKAEYDIFNNIFKNYKNRTALIVSHRFSTVRRADRIIVLDHGKVIQTGSHKELMDDKGLYKDMFDKQAEGYN
ncbi:MAG: ABC transporter ATP-binding protein, partial [Patescibacteria group bacterium]